MYLETLGDYLSSVLNSFIVIAMNSPNHSNLLFLDDVYIARYDDNEGWTTAIENC